MKRLFLASFMIISSFLLAIVRADENAERAAQNSAVVWLALVDSSKYSESWEEASQLFKRQVTKQQWETALNSVRSPLGKLNSRSLKSAEYSTTLPGAPDGEYVVMQFETSFEKKKSAIETVASMKDEGKWKVSGYYIK
jgi:hypothetical protein